MNVLRTMQRGPRLYGLNKKDGFLPHPFDLENGVRTSGLIVGRHLKTGSPRDRQTTAYYGVAPSVFQALVRRWRRMRPAHPLEETTFLDIGAGMGRAVLLAAEMPFHDVIGVEMHPDFGPHRPPQSHSLAQGGARHSADANGRGRCDGVCISSRSLRGVPLQSLWRGSYAKVSAPCGEKFLRPSARHSLCEQRAGGSSRRTAGPMKSRAILSVSFPDRFGARGPTPKPITRSSPTSPTASTLQPIMRTARFGAGRAQAGNKLGSCSIRNLRR